MKQVAELKESTLYPILKKLKKAGAQQLMQELGSPKEAAQELIANLLDKKTSDLKESKKQSPFRHFHIILLTILGILAAPVSLPLSIIFFLILLVLILLPTFGIISLFVAFVTLLWKGCHFIIGSIKLFSFSLPAFSTQFGQGTLSVGIGILKLLSGSH